MLMIGFSHNFCYRREMTDWIRLLHVLVLVYKKILSQFNYHQQQYFLVFFTLLQTFRTVKFKLTLNAPIRFPWLTRFLPVKTCKHIPCTFIKTNCCQLAQIPRPEVILKQYAFHENKRKLLTFSPWQACFVIAHSPGDF